MKLNRSRDLVFLILLLASIATLMQFAMRKRDIQIEGLRIGVSREQFRKQLESDPDFERGVDYHKRRSTGAIIEYYEDSKSGQVTCIDGFNKASLHVGPISIITCSNIMGAKDGDTKDTVREKLGLPNEIDNDIWSYHLPEANVHIIWTLQDFAGLVEIEATSTSP